MATQNVALTRTYSLIANNLQNFFLTLPWTTGAVIEIATADSEVVPVMRGHEISGKERGSISRVDVGPGYVYARCKSGSTRTVILNVWAIT